MAISDFRSETN